MGLFDQCFAHLGDHRDPPFEIKRRPFPTTETHGSFFMARDPLLGIQPILRIGPGRFDLIERAQALAREQGLLTVPTKRAETC